MVSQGLSSTRGGSRPPPRQEAGGRLLSDFEDVVCMCVWGGGGGSGDRVHVYEVSRPPFPKTTTTGQPFCFLPLSQYIYIISLAHLGGLLLEFLFEKAPPLPPVPQGLGLGLVHLLDVLLRSGHPPLGHVARFRGLHPRLSRRLNSVAASAFRHGHFFFDEVL